MNQVRMMNIVTAELVAALGSTSQTCAGCGHIHSPEGCTGPPTPSDVWAGVMPAACDCHVATIRAALTDPS
jgi:hypothetical protein